MHSKPIQLSDFVNSFIKDNKPQIEKYKKYFKDNHWGKPVVEKNEKGKITYSKYYYVKDVKVQGQGVLHEGKEPEYKIQDKIVKTVLSRLKYFHSFVESDIGKSVKVDRMIKSMVDLIQYHTRRIDSYIRNSDSLEEKEEAEGSEKTQKDYQSDEIAFDNLLYENRASINDGLDKLDLEQKKEQSLLELKDDAKAPLSMREKIEEEFPNIKKYVESLDLDFTTPPKNEMFINIENPPLWDENKHYFEQEKKTLQFYIDEFKKIRDGIKINGVYISGWLYTHLNVFKAPIPTQLVNPVSGELYTKDKIKHPPLRDNEWFIIQDSYQKAKEEDKMMFLCATRRAAKTTLISSHLQWKALSGGVTLVVAGGSAKDLGHIEKGFKITMTNAHPAFKLPNISNDWSKTVKLGIKKKNQKDILASTLDIYNLDGGAETKSEILAGLTPDAFVLDECMKSPFKSQLDAALPAFEAYGKFRFIPILSGTGGSEELAKDATKILKDPSKYRVCEMDWNALEEKIPAEHITWKRRKFATFLPGQMSVVASDLRIESNLSEYLGVKSKTLEKIPILVTDWGKSKERFQKRRAEKEHDKKSLYKEKVYFPLDPEDILLSGNENPFPKEALRRHRDRIIEEGDIGKNVELFYDERLGKVTYELSNKEVAEFPFGGGFHDSPVTIYEDPLPNAPFELSVAGCLLPGEKVLTGKGAINVEDVTLEDKLINKDGEYVKINNLQTRYKNNENVYSIRVGGNCRYTTFTKEHPIYISRPNYYQTELSKGRVKKYNFGEEQFVEAKDLQEGDWVKFPNVYYNKKNNFDINKLWDKHKDTVDCPFSNEDFWLFVGTFLGDGWTEGDYKVCVVFNKTEDLHKNNCIHFIKNTLKRKVREVWKEGKNCSEIHFSCKELNSFLNENFSKYALNKNIPEWVKKIDDKYKYNLLCGYLNSDGCTMNHPKGNLYTKFVSISHKLLEDIQDILYSLNIMSSITKLREESYHSFNNKYTSKTKKTYQLCISQEGTLKLHENFRKNTTLKSPKVLRKVKKYRKGKESFISDDGKFIYNKIIDIKTKKYTGFVYNFDCETHTFITKNITTHNCDDYKQEQANSDSVGSFVLIRRDTGTVVASYHSRPDPHGKFHEQGKLLLELYNAPVFMENEDMGFKEYMDRQELTDEYILKSVDFLGDVSFDTNSKRQYGWQPTSKNKSFLFGVTAKIIDKKEEYEDTEGRVRQRYVFERTIKDIRLLDEMINYKPGGNFDGLTALMSAYGYDFYLEVTGQAPQRPLTEEEKRKKEEQLRRRKENTKRRSMFPRSHRRGKLW